MQMQIVGLGSFGSMLANQIAKQHPTLKSQCLAVDSDSAVLDRLKTVKNKLLIGKGESSLGVFDYGLALAIKYKSVIQKALGKKVILIGGCGATSWGLGYFIVKSLVDVEIYSYNLHMPLPSEGEVREAKGQAFFKFLRDGGGRGKGPIKYIVTQAESVSPLEETVKEMMLDRMKLN